MVSSSDTLFVGSNLDIVQDYHLQPKIATCVRLLRLEGVNYGSCGNYRSFFT